MRKSVSDSGSKNYSSLPLPTATTCEGQKIGPIDDSFLIHPSSSEYISNPAFFSSGFMFSNQVLLANHFAQQGSKGQVRDTVLSIQTNDDQNDSSIFRWIFKRRSAIKEASEPMNAKNIPSAGTDGLPNQKGNDENIATVEAKEEDCEEEEKGNMISSNTLPHPCTSISSSPFKMSYSSDEIDRLLQMTPEKSRWNKSERKNWRIRKMKESEGGKSGNERKSLKESSSFFSTSNEESRNDDESLERGKEENFTKCMNNKEHSYVSGIPNRSRTCSLCLETKSMAQFHTIWSCGCSFCRPCLSQYLMTCIRENINVPFLSCPSADCPQIRKSSHNSTSAAVKQVLTRTFTSLIQYDNVNSASAECNLENKFSRQEIEMLVDERCFDLYLKLKMEFEVEMDPNRTFCPSVDCENICIISKSMIVTVDPTVQLKSTNSSVMISSLSVSSTLSSLAAASSSAVSSVIKKGGGGSHFISKETDAFPVLCNKCDRTFCYRCRKQPFHVGSPCSRLSLDPTLAPPFDGDGDGPEIKRCPRCSIWIEREDGCAQMMCRKCRHVFCWFCLQSLEDDLLLRHFDRGPCKNKLGHSRASVIWHRTQVVGIFAGFGVLLLLASPLFLVAAPCFFCCSCCCSSLSSLNHEEDEENISPSPSLPNDEGDQDMIITKQPTLQI